MKIRNSFVSNSSSSSFIVKFPVIPKTVQELQKMLFGDEEIIQPYDAPFTTLKLSKQVFQDMKKQKEIMGSYYGTNKKIGINKMIMSLIENSWDVSEEADKIFGKDYFAIHKEGRAQKEIKKDEKAKDIIEKQVANKMYKNFMKKHGRVYIFCYSDNDGDFFSALEHGEIFNKLEHLVISHH